MAVQHLAFGAAFGARGQHVLLAQLVQEAVFGEQRHGGEGGQPHGNHRQDQVPEIIEDLLPPGKLRPAFGGQAAQREDLPERAAGEQHDQEDGEQESGDGVADDDHARRPDVVMRAVVHRLADAERNRDQIGEQRHPDTERDRDRQLLLDQVDHPHVAKIALAEIEAQVIPQHDEKALIGRLVEAELLLQVPDEGRVEPLCAAISGIGAALRARGAGAGEYVAIGGTGNAPHRAGSGARELGDDVFHRSARSELHHHERHQHDSEDRRDHEQESADNVSGHAVPLSIPLPRREGECGRFAHAALTIFRSWPPWPHPTTTAPGTRLCRIAAEDRGG